MPRQPGRAMRYFTAETNNKNIYKCKFCHSQYTKHATRMTAHLLKCSRCPEEIKKYLKSSNDLADKISVNLDGKIESSSSIIESGSESSVTRTRDFRTSGTSGSTLDYFMDFMNPKEKDGLDKSLARAIYASGSPLSLTENSKWKEFFNSIRPSYKLPSRYDISKPLLDLEFKTVSENVDAKIREAMTVGIQCDGWSNIRNQAIINVVVTTPQPVLYKTFTTGAERHTAEYIAQELKKCIEEIGSNKVIGIVTDNAAAMIKARKIVAEELKIIEYGCISHCLNLLVGDIMKCNSLKDLEGHCKQIVKEISGSHIALATFNKIQLEKKGETTSLKLPVSTRWGSILNCLDSLISNKYPLKQLVITEEVADKLSANVKKNCLDDDIFWVKVEKLANILRPIVSYIHKLEADNINLSEVSEAFRKLETAINQEVSSLPILKKEEEAVLTCFTQRKSKILCGAHFAANILDPRYMGQADYLTTEEHAKGMDFIHWLVVNNNNFKENQCEILVELAQYAGKAAFFSNAYLWKNTDKIDSNTWWKGYCGRTVLKDVALAIISLAPSSAATERSFSRYSFIHTKKRNRLSVERAGKLAYISFNLNLEQDKTFDNKSPKEQTSTFSISKEIIDEETMPSTSRYSGEKSSIILGPSCSNTKRKRTEELTMAVDTSDTETETDEEISLHDSDTSEGSEDFGDLDFIEKEKDPLA